MGTDLRGWWPGWGSSLPRFWEDWTPHCERRPWPCGFCGFSCCLTRKSACSGPFSASGRERVMYDANQLPWKCGGRLHQRPASLLWVRCCCGAVTWTPRGCLGLSSCIPKSWYCGAQVAWGGCPSHCCMGHPNRGPRGVESS